MAEILFCKLNAIICLGGGARQIVNNKKNLELFFWNGKERGKKFRTINLTT